MIEVDTSKLIVGGGRDHLKVRNATKKGYDEAYEGDSVNLAYPASNKRRARVGHGVANTIQTSGTMGVVVNLKRGYEIEVKNEAQDTDEIDVIGNYSKSNYQGTAIVGKQGVSPTIRENHGQVTGVVVVGNVNPSGKGQRGNVADSEGIARTIDTNKGEGQFIQKNLRIRKLTPKECWRLMGFTDEEFEKAEKVNSNTQLYKQAGNSIVVDVLVAILKNLLTCDRNEKDSQLTMFGDIENIE